MKGGQAKPAIGWLQYSLASDVAVGTGLGTNVTQIIDLTVDEDSFPNGLLTKSTNSRFQAVVNCSVRVSYGVTADGSGNEQGWEARVLKNGVIVPQSPTGSNARGALEEPSEGSRTFVTELTAGQYLELEVMTIELLTTVTYTTRGTFMLVEIVRLT